MSGVATSILAGQTANINAMYYTADGIHEAPAAALLVAASGMFNPALIVR